MSQLQKKKESLLLTIKTIIQWPPYSRLHHKTTICWTHSRWPLRAWCPTTRQVYTRHSLWWTKLQRCHLATISLRRRRAAGLSRLAASKETNTAIWINREERMGLARARSSRATSGSEPVNTQICSRIPTWWHYSTIRIGSPNSQQSIITQPTHAKLHPSSMIA